MFWVYYRDDGRRQERRRRTWPVLRPHSKSSSVCVSISFGLAKSHPFIVETREVKTHFLRMKENRQRRRCCEDLQPTVLYLPNVVFLILNIVIALLLPPSPLRLWHLQHCTSVRLVVFSLLILLRCFFFNYYLRLSKAGVDLKKNALPGCQPSFGQSNIKHMKNGTEKWDRQKGKNMIYPHEIRNKPEQLEDTGW